MVSVLESFGEGFRLTSQHFERLILPTLSIFFVQFIILMYEDLLALVANPIPLLLFAPFIGIAGAAGQVWLFSRSLALVTHHKNPFRWSAAFALFGYMLIVSLMARVLVYILGLAMIATSASLTVVFALLLLWPALLVFLLIRFLTFVPEITVDRREKDAFERTWQLTSGHFWQVVRFMLLSIFVILAGIAALGVGVLFAFPMVVVASVHFYEQLRREAKHAKRS